ncbi:MAG TPA: pirin family protein, partial [Chitinophagaceae bacterium]|nr:pirin family protein [Chitinophagaceae bacterium]
MKRVIERIFPLPSIPGMVGDGFRVFNLIPGAGITQQRISPFLLLDFNTEFEFPPSEKVKGVNVHPHKGFETVTIAYKGSVAHHDSAGNSGVINPGDVQWMTAGSGVLHKEYHEKEYSKRGGPFEMVQLWVNLPKKNKSVPPHYQELKASVIEKVILPDNKGVINVIAGSHANVIGPAHTYTPINLFDIKLMKNGEVLLDVSATQNAALLVVNGNVEVNEVKAKEHSFVLFRNEGNEIILKAEDDSV